MLFSIQTKRELTEDERFALAFWIWLMLFMMMCGVWDYDAADKEEE